MNNKKIFDSISSDNNVFDLEHIFRRTIKDMGIAEADFVRQLREHYKTKFPYLSGVEMANFVTQFLTSEMTFERFQEAMDVLGCKIDITIHSPVKVVKNIEIRSGPRPPQFLFFDKNVAELNLPFRVLNVLRAGEVTTFGDLVQKTEHEVFRFVNMGKVGMEQLKTAMREHGLSFGMDVRGWKAATQSNFSLSNPIEALRLGDKINQALRNKGVSTVGELCALDAFALRNLRELSVRDDSLIVLALREHGFKLAPAMQAGKPCKISSVFERGIEDVLELDTGTLNALHSHGHYQLKQLVALQEDELRDIAGIGSTRFRRLVNDLIFMRLSLGMKDID